MAFCGTPEQALEIAADPTCLQTITTCKEYDDYEEYQDGDDQKQYVLIPCQQLCGHVYCSRECQQDDWENGGHKELCTGGIEEDNQNQKSHDENDSKEIQHPLLEFKRHAIANNEIFLVVATWIARILNGNIPYYDDDRQHSHPYTDFMMKPWWDVACSPLFANPMGFAEAIELESSLKRLCKESCQFLQAAWSSHPSKSSPWVTQLAISRLIGSIELNCMGIRRKHAIRKNVMEDINLRHSHHLQLVACLERAGMIGDGEDCCEEDEGEVDDDNGEEEGEKEEGEKEEEENGASDIAKAKAGVQLNKGKQEIQNQNDRPSYSSLLGPEEEWDYSYDEIAAFLAGLPPPMKIGSDDEWDTLFTPLDGTAMYSTASKMNHSCDPNVVLLYKTRGWGRDHPLVAYCVALRDIQEDEELTISYIVSDDDYPTRQAALANYGFVCECSKCQREKVGMVDASSKQLEENGEEASLFGDDSENDDDGADGENLDLGDNDLDGEAKLMTAVEKLESELNQSTYAVIPLNYLPSVSNYVLKLATALLKDKVNSEGIADTVRKLLQQCINGIQDRDFSLCRIVGTDLELTLYHQLKKNRSWPSLFYREAYWCASITSAVGFAHEGSFLVSMKFLDKATILGLPRNSIEDFFSYVELYASQMALAPCPPAIECNVVDYNNPTIADQVKSGGLSRPILFPVEEVKIESIDGQDFFASVQKPILIRKLALNWQATRSLRDMQNFVRQYGHRLVPVEVGSISTGMQEKLFTIRNFVAKYLTPSTGKLFWSLDDAVGRASQVAYIAQHPLFDQITDLYDMVDKQPFGVAATNINVWIGTGGTRTPLHFDTYDNLLVQVVGVKYVRLYAVVATPNLYMTKDSSYGLQGNMSQLDCELEDYEKHPLAQECAYSEVLLFPGDCLYIPARQWHYVRSLSTSASVNYWF